MRWTTRPSSPGWRPSYPNLVGAIVLGEGGGGPSDLITNTRGVLSGTVAPVWDRPEPTDLRPTLFFTNSAGATLHSYVDFGARSGFLDLGMGTPMTLIARVFFTGVGTDGCGIAQRVPANWPTSSTGWAWGVSGGPGGTCPMFLKFRAGAACVGRQAGTTMPTNQWVTLAVTYEGEIGNNGGSIKNYLNGILLNDGNVSGGGAGSNTTDSAEPFIFGDTAVWMPGVGNPAMYGSFAGRIAWLLAFNRVLSANELLTFNYERNVPTALWGGLFPVPRRARYFPIVYTGPTLLISGEDVTPLIRIGDIFQNPTFSWTRNQRSLLTFDIEGSYAKRAEVLWYSKDGSTPILGGFIERREPIEVPVDEDVPFCSRVEVVDFSRVYDWCYWTKNYTSDKTRKEVLTDLVDEKLSEYDITLDPAQDDGPTYTAPFGWTDVLVAEVMKFLVGADSIDRITPLQVLKVFVVGTEAAPVSITTANRKASRLTWADSTQVPANTVIGIFGADISEGYDKIVNHAWVTDGVATTFAINDDNNPGSQQFIPVIVFVDSVQYPVFRVNTGPSDGVHWDPNMDNGTLSFDGTFVSLVASPGLDITIDYFPLLPYRLEVTTAAAPRIEKLVPHPSIWQWAQAQTAIADDLAQLDQDDARIFTIDTLEDGLFPGQALAIDVPEREADDVEAIITAVQGVANTDLFWEYTVTAEEADQLQIDTIAALKQLFGRAA